MRRSAVSSILVLTAAVAAVVLAAPAEAGRPVASAAGSGLNLPLARQIPSELLSFRPERMADTGDGTQLITAVTNGRTNAARSGTLTWWQRSGKKWVKVGSTPARFGANGLSDQRLEGDRTTPTGLFTVPMAFGIKADPGTKLPWKSVNSKSWWVGNAQDSHYNSWYQNCPASVCWKDSVRAAGASEHLADYAPQYNYAALIGFNTGVVKVLPPARPSGSGIFLHVNGSGYTAGCVSVSQAALVSILRWLDPAAAPHIAIGNSKTIRRF